MTGGMRSLMASHLSLKSPVRIALALLSLTFAPPPAIANPHKPLPAQVVSQAPGIHPLGRGRHKWWGIQMYDATLWIVGASWSPAEPHALDLEPSRAVAGDTLVNTAISEMRELEVGDEPKLKAWRKELRQVMPSVQPGDQVVIFCPEDNKTLVYYNSRSHGEIHDPTLCPAIMNVWLHLQTKHQAVRKSLLGQ